MRFRLRTLFLLFVVASAFLSCTVLFLQWWKSRPGAEVRGYLGEVDDIRRQLGKESLPELRMWRLYNPSDPCFLWTAKAPPESITILQKSMRLRPISQSQVPELFWKMPSSFSETPPWWKPKPTVAAEYFMSPIFVPGGASGESNLDGVVMYDPAEKRVWVWSQFGF